MPTFLITFVVYSYIYQENYKFLSNNIVYIEIIKIFFIRENTFTFFVLNDYFVFRILIVSSNSSNVNKIFSSQVACNINNIRLHT